MTLTSLRSLILTCNRIILKINIDMPILILELLMKFLFISWEQDPLFQALSKTIKMTSINLSGSRLLCHKTALKFIEKLLAWQNYYQKLEVFSVPILFFSRLLLHYLVTGPCNKSLFNAFMLPSQKMIQHREISVIKLLLSLILIQQYLKTRIS